MLHKVSGTDGKLLPYSVIAFRKESWPNIFALRFLGSAFTISTDGWIATCAHVVNPLNDDEDIAVIRARDCRAFRALEIRSSNKLDVACIKIDDHDVFYSPVLDPLLMGNTVTSIGYSLLSIDDGKISVIPRYQNGYITSYPTINYKNLPTDLPYYQISFPGLCGFSGAGLFLDLDDGMALCGMVFGNELSEIVERSISEVSENGKMYSERVSRIWECGTAHTMQCLLKAFAEMKVPCFK